MHCIYASQGCKFKIVKVGNGGRGSLHSNLVPSELATKTIKLKCFNCPYSCIKYQVSKSYFRIIKDGLWSASVPGPALSVYSMVTEHEVTALHFTKEGGRGNEWLEIISQLKNSNQDFCLQD